MFNVLARFDLLQKHSSNAMVARAVRAMSKKFQNQNLPD